MRVQTLSMQDFIENLACAGPASVFGKVIYVDVSANPVDHVDKRKASKFRVVIQASTVIEVEDGAEYILQVGEDCGYDYHDASQEMVGTERALDLKKELQDWCRRNGLTVRPGILSE